MRRAALFLAFAMLAGCEEPKPHFAADCGDGTRITGAREVVESRCARRGGVRAITPLPDGAPPAGNETAS